MTPERFRHFPFLPWGRREFFDEWIIKHKQQVESVALLKSRPHFSVLIPMSKLFAGEYLEWAMRSLLLQSYPDWTAHLISDEKRGRPEFGDEFSDARFSFTDMAGASRAELLQTGLQQAKGNWITVLNPSDLLGPSTLFEIAHQIGQEETDLLYTNEAQIDRQGRRILQTLSKPSFSEFNLAQFNYIGGLWTARTDHLRKAEGFLGEDAFAEHDALFRLIENGSLVTHLPVFGYYRRSDFSTATPPANRVKKFLKATKIEANVNPEGKIIPSPTDELVSTIISFRNHSEWTIQSIDALLKIQGTHPLELILIDNGSSSAERSAIESKLQGLSVSWTIIDEEGPFNFARLHNRAIERANGDLLLLLNNDVFLKESVDLKTWASWTIQDWVGTVGVRLVFPNGQTQHGGLRALSGGAYRMARIGNAQSDDPTLKLNREVFGNSFAAVMFKKKTFQQLGGLDPIRFPNGFGDVVFNFECLRQGLKNLLLGEMVGTHLESATRGQKYEYWEESRLENEYPDLIKQMKRNDLGINRAPETQETWKDLVRDGLSHPALRASWSAPIRPWLKRVFGPRIEGS